MTKERDSGKIQLYHRGRQQIWLRDARDITHPELITETLEGYNLHTRKEMQEPVMRENRPVDMSDAPYILLNGIFSDHGRHVNLGLEGQAFLEGTVITREGPMARHRQNDIPMRKMGEEGTPCSRYETAKELLRMADELEYHSPHLGWHVFRNGQRDNVFKGFIHRRRRVERTDSIARANLVVYRFTQQAVRT